MEASFPPCMKGFSNLYADAHSLRLTRDSSATQEIITVLLQNVTIISGLLQYVHRLFHAVLCRPILQKFCNNKGKYKFKYVHM